MASYIGSLVELGAYDGATYKGILKQVDDKSGRIELGEGQCTGELNDR